MDGIKIKITDKEGNIIDELIIKVADNSGMSIESSKNAEIVSRPVCDYDYLRDINYTVYTVTEK